MIRFLSRRWLFIVPLFILTFVLAACGGGTPPVTSWPGYTVKDSTAYLASADQLLAIDVSGDVIGAVRGWPVKSPNATIGFYSEPAVMTDTLYVGTEQSNGNNGNVVAYVNIERSANQNPTVKWSYPLTTTDAPLGNIYGAIVREDNVLYLADGKGQVFALDADTGNPQWAQPYQTGARIWSSPVVQGDRVYAASQDHFLYALGKSSGQLVWKFPSNGTSIDALVGSPTVYSNTVYAGSFGGILYAVDASNGTLMWSFKADGTLWDGPAEAKGTLYFGDLSGNVYALDSETGQTKKWTAKVEGGVKMTPLVVDGVVYVGTDQHRMYAFKADTGQAVWAQPYSARDGENFLVTPIVNGGTLLALPNLAGGDPVRLYGLNKNTGALLWRYPPAPTQ